MGEAFVSVADDANAVLFNAAGFAQLRGFEITGMYSDLYSNLNARLYTGAYDRLGYNFLSAAIPASESLGTFGVSWSHLYSSFYKENVFTLTYAREILQAHGLDFGVNLKALQWMVESNDFTRDPLTYPYAAREKLGYTADVGLLSTPFAGLTLGASMDNVIPVNMALAGSHQVAPIIRAGLALKHTWRENWIDAVQIALEWNDRDRISNTKLGMEGWFFQDSLAVRAGVNLYEVTSGLSLRFTYPKSSFQLQMDYAFSYPFEIFDSYGSHRFGLTLRFTTPKAEPRKEAAKPALIDEYYQKALKAYLMNDLQESLKWWERIVALDPDNIAAKRYVEEIRGRLAAGGQPVATPYQAGDITVLSQGADLEPDALYMRIKLQNLRSLAPVPEQPEYSDNLHTHQSLAEQYDQQNDYARALEEWETVAALDPKNPAAAAQIEAIQRRLAARIEDPFRQGLLDFNEKKYVQALRQFQRVLKLAPDHGQARFFLNKTKDILSGQLQKFYQEGVEWFRRKNLRRASRAFENVRAIDPDYRDTLKYLGQLSAQQQTRVQPVSQLQQQYGAAQRYFAQTRVTDALNLLAPLIESGVYTEAMYRLFNDALQQRAQSLRYYHDALKSYAATDLDQAVANARKSIELNRQSEAQGLLVKAYVQQGILDYRQDNLPGAQAAWENARAVDPGNPLIQKYLQRVKNKIKFYKEIFGEDYFKGK